MEHIQQVSRRNTKIFISLWGFVFGVLLASLVHIPPLVSLLIILVSLAVYAVDRNVFILIALTAFAVGVLRYDIKDFHTLVPAGGSGVIVAEPERRDIDTRFVVRTDTGENVLVTTDLYSEVEYGDEVVLLGTPKTLKPGGFADYLAKDDIYYTLDRAKLEVVSKDKGHKVVAMLLSLKSSLVEKTRDILPEPESSLLSGLIVSGKQALPKETLEEFRRAGVVHMVVLSGYNITIIAEFLLFLFGFLGTRRSAHISLSGILLFTLMSGAPATVVRGAIMVSLLLLGKLMHRSGAQFRIILSTAVVMLMYNPKYLVFDASFQLSFLAVLGLVYGAPIFNKYLIWITEKYKLRELVSTTLATQFFVFPYLLYNMGDFSLVFLLANILILPVVPVVMLIGFVATLVAFVSNILAWPLAFLSHILLSWILFVAEVLGNLPFANLEIENFPLWGSLVMYGFIFFIVWRFRDSLKHSPNLGF